MNILIVGCGKVGYTLAETLCTEGHDITVVDMQEDKIKRAVNTLDVAGVRGNGGSYSVLCSAGVEHCDVLIATTSQDEVNIICCLVARKAAHCRTIARVRNPDYYSEIGFIQDELGLSMAINPELSAATACYQLIQVPYAMEMDSFARGLVEMITLVLPTTSQWCGKKLMDITRSSRIPFLLAIVERQHTAIIPNGNTTLESGDRLSIVLDTQYIKQILDQIGIRHRPIRSVMIASGGNVGYYLAKRLCDANIRVTVIEPQYDRCQQLCELLPKATIIHGDPCSETLLMEEGLAEADAFAALSGNDSENITLSLYAGKVSQAKLITRINKRTMGGVISELPIGSTITPKDLTAEHILRYARALRGDSSSSGMDAVYRLCNGRVEALSFSIRSECRITGVKLADLPIQTGVLICGIIRNGHVIIPGGQDTICPNDQVIITTTHVGIADVQDILS